MAEETDGIAVQDEPLLRVGRLRTLIQDAHRSFRVGAGTISSYFELLGSVKIALTDIARSGAPACPVAQCLRTVPEPRVLSTAV